MIKKKFTKVTLQSNFYCTFNLLAVHYWDLWGRSCSQAGFIMATINSDAVSIIIIDQIIILNYLYIWEFDLDLLQANNNFNFFILNKTLKHYFFFLNFKLVKIKFCKNNFI